MTGHTGRSLRNGANRPLVFRRAVPVASMLADELSEQELPGPWTAGKPMEGFVVLTSPRRPHAEGQDRAHGGISRPQQGRRRRLPQRQPPLCATRQRSGPSGPGRHRLQGPASAPEGRPAPGLDQDRLARQRRLRASLQRRDRPLDCRSHQIPASNPLALLTGATVAATASSPLTSSGTSCATEITSSVLLLASRPSGRVRDQLDIQRRRIANIVDAEPDDVPFAVLDEVVFKDEQVRRTRPALRRNWSAAFSRA
jgi:hypothetical protein